MTNDRERFTLGSDAEWIRRLREENERLRAELTRREREAEEQQRRHRRQERRIDGLERQNERQKLEIDHLKQQLATARRAGFRQAAPFAKNRPQGRGGRPGRRAAADYGQKARRRRPTRVDETFAAPVPEDVLGALR